LIYENLFTDFSSLLLKNTAAEFARGIRLIEGIENEIYTFTTNGTNSIGAQFRHNYDFANGFLKGLKTGKIDYTQRERDLNIERNRQYAIERFVFLIKSLGAWPSNLDQLIVSVRSEIDEGAWYFSSAARELEFLHSHTVHHHALIAEKLNLLGFTVDGEFGVAPSTLKFWAQQNKVA
jgi:hypothetical protein